MMWLDGLLGFFAAFFMGGSGLNPEGGAFAGGSGLNPEGGAFAGGSNITPDG